MRFIDWFAGVGGFRRGMELAGHECVGFCELDKYAVMSYTSMHLITEEQRQYLMTLPLKQRQREILKEEYRNGEWYATDIRRVYSGDIPDADCWCFGFPCQDISIGGKQLGFTGNRSSLFFRVMYILGQLEEEKKPTWLFIENVKNLLSVNGGWDFARLLAELDERGYDAEWDVLNSKDFGVPQSRERVFVIGHLRGRGGREVFPVAAGGEETSGVQRQLLANTLKVSNHVVGTYLATDRQTDRWYSRLMDITRSNKRHEYQESRECVQRSSRLQVPGWPCVRSGWHLSLLENTKWGGAVPMIELKEPYRIRKLTPRECFRLQGWEDEYFDRAQMVNSDSQLYKQAGNGVTVTVIQAIAERFDDGSEN